MAERGGHPDLSRLVSAWVEDVDELTRHDEARLHAGVPTRRRIRRLPRAASAVLAASAALVSASGVAAAVTGDPLAVYRPAIDSLLRVDQPPPAHPQVRLGAEVPGGTGEAGPRAALPGPPAGPVPAVGVSRAPAPVSAPVASPPPVSEAPSPTGSEPAAPHGTAPAGASPQGASPQGSAPEPSATMSPSPGDGDEPAVVQPQATVGTLSPTDPVATATPTGAASPGASGAAGTATGGPGATLP